MRTAVRFVRVACLALASATVGLAQITNVTADQKTPLPGGHDYIHMLTETVDPASGQLSIRIQVPVAKGRGLTLPFSFAYDSSGLIYPASYAGTGQHYWAQATVVPGVPGGWSYTFPFLSTQSVHVRDPNFGLCTYWISYVFSDASGQRHPLYLSAYGGGSTNIYDCQQQGVAEYVTGGNDFVQAQISDPATGGDGSVRVVDADGTVYRFGSGSTNLLPTWVEDPNGNEVTFGASGYYSMTDTAGRVAISASSIGNTTSGDTISVSGLPASYQVTWSSTIAPYNYNPGRFW